MVNMSDVAKLAGVSMQTVSRVINNKDQVSEDTHAAVRAAIEQLGYRPNPTARALASRRSRTIGVVSTGIAAHSLSKRLLAFNEAARAAGYQVSIFNFDDVKSDEVAQAVDALLQQRVEGLVLIAADRLAIESIQKIDIGVPFVAAESGGLSGPQSVSIDQFLGARLATRHLIDLGHQDIRHLAGPSRSLDALERLRGWQTEMSTAGLLIHPPMECDWRAESGYLAGLQLAKKENRGFTAVFSANDQMAVGLLHAFSESGIRVPEDVSVVGFDDNPESAHLIPPLTTIRQDFDELGRRIMSTLIALIEGTEPDVPTLTTPELIVRQSTAPRR